MNIQIKQQFRTRDGRVAKIVSDTSNNAIASMAGFSFRCVIEGKINEEYFITSNGMKFETLESGYDLVELIEEHVIDGDPTNPFFSIANTLTNIETRWNLNGSMGFTS